MKTLIIDASSAASWLIPSQNTPAAAALETDLDGYVLRAPGIFPWEMRNVLLRQRRRTPAYDLAGAVERLTAYAIDISEMDATDHLDVLTEVADRGGVSLFDAAYFWLAASDGSTLASRDAGLLALCRANGVETVDLR